jgi:hypothetical protein
MKINKGILQMIPIRVTFGGAVVGFDFRKLLNEAGDLVCFRVYDIELPPELKEKFDAVIAEIGAHAEKHDKLASIAELKNTMNVFEAREAMTTELTAKAKSMIKANKGGI